jgi:hypothetical protein
MDKPKKIDIDPELIEFCRQNPDSELAKRTRRDIEIQQTKAEFAKVLLNAFEEDMLNPLIRLSRWLLG